MIMEAALIPKPALGAADAAEAVSEPYFMKLRRVIPWRRITSWKVSLGFKACPSFGCCS